MTSDPVVVLAIAGAVTCVVLAVAVVSLPWAAREPVVSVPVHGRMVAFDKVLAQELRSTSEDELVLASATIGTFDSATWQPLVDAARGRYPN